MIRTSAALGASLLALAAGAPGAAATPARVDLVKAITGDTPFPDKCGSPDSYQTGSEGEPHLAVDPEDPRRMLVFNQQDRAAGGGGGSLVNVLRATRDAGRTWAIVPLPETSPCYGGSAPAGASDPWVAIGRGGRAYASQDAGDPNPLAVLGGFGIDVSRSPDAGSTWSKPTHMTPFGLDNPGGSDRSTITPDPSVPDHAYLVWTRFDEPDSDLLFTQTWDGGRTWAPARVIASFAGSIVRPGADHGPWGAQVSVLPDGTLVTTFLVFSEPARQMAISSADGGATWSPPVQIGATSQKHPYDPDDERNEVRDEPWPVPAVMPDGSIFVAFYDVRGPRESPILLSRSTDGGATWTSPRPAIAGPTQHFDPMLAAMPDGTLGLTYYDFRNDKSGDGQLTTDYWLAHSHDGGTSWEETHLGGPFDSLTAAVAVNPQARGRFLGEYQGLVALPNGFASAFTQARPAAASTPSDIFFARVRVSTPALKLTVKPRRVRRGRTDDFRFCATTVEDGRRGIVGATVRFAGRSALTDATGCARMRVQVGHRRVYRALVVKPGYRRGSAVVRTVG